MAEKSVSAKLEELLELTASKTSSLDLAPALSFLIHYIDDSSPTFCKHSILCCSRLVLKILFTLNLQVSEATKNLWRDFIKMKSKIISTAKFSHNDGVIIHSLKFMEVIILAFTARDPQTPSFQNESLFSVEMIPSQHPFLSRPQLEREGEELLHTLVSWLEQIGNWSSTAIIVVITCLTSIVKQRPQFVSLIAPALMQIPKRLNTISSQSQLPSIKNSLRTSLSSIAKIRHPAVSPYLQPLLNMLPVLGALRTEAPKKPLQSETPSDQNNTIFSQRHGAEPIKETIDLTTASQFVEILLNAQLTPDIFADLVIDNMVNLPPFPATSGPSPFDPFDYLIKSLLQIQTSTPSPSPPPQPAIPLVSNSNIQPMFHPQTPIPPLQPRSREISRDPRLGNKEVPFNPPPEPMKEVPISMPVAPPMVYSPKIPILSQEELQILHESSFMRILSSEKGASVGGKAQLRASILSYLASQIELGHPLLQTLHSHIFEDFVTRKELALQWLITEFKIEETRMQEENSSSRYEFIFLQILNELKQFVATFKDQKSFSFLFIKVPKLTQVVYDILKSYCEDLNSVTLGLSTLRDIILYRTEDFEQALDILLYYTQFEVEAIRSPAIRLVTNKLFGNKEELTQKIETFGISSLHSLPVNEEISEKLEEDIKRKLLLFFALCTKKPSILTILVETYTQVPPSVKKIIHSQCGGLIKTIGMNCPEFLQLLGNIPHKGEPLILHFLHILTEKARPTSQLISTIKNLYQKRVLDARFMIPILPGLEKNEAMDFIHKLTTLPSTSIKSALLNTLKNPAISPSDLLIALHLIDIKDPEHLKKSIEATQLCFDQKDIFQQDVLAVVIQQLVDINPLPPLLFRTIIQTISRYPKLIGFVMGILSRLLNKNIWNDHKLWEGFIKTCQRTIPHSCPILIQVPTAQLEDILQKCPELKQPLANYCRSYSNKVKTIPVLQKLLEE